jgi:hypothetical protein
MLHMLQVYIKARAFIATPLIYMPPSGDRVGDVEWAGGNDRGFQYSGGTSKGDLIARFILDDAGYSTDIKCASGSLTFVRITCGCVGAAERSLRQTHVMAHDRSRRAAVELLAPCPQRRARPLQVRLHAIREM